MNLLKNSLNFVKYVQTVIDMFCRKYSFMWSLFEVLCKILLIFNGFLYS